VVRRGVVALTAGITQHYDVAIEAAVPVGSIAGDVELTSGSVWPTTPTMAGSCSSTA
jgi:hypothetical protein